MKMKLESRYAILGFMIGDALSAPFEFGTPVIEELDERWNGKEPLRFTDDSHLVLS